MFDIPLPTYFFTKEYPLKKSSKRIHVPDILFFIPHFLIELNV